MTLTPEQQKQLDRINSVAEANIQQEIIARDHIADQIVNGPDLDENRRDWNESPQESKP